MSDNSALLRSNEGNPQNNVSSYNYDSRAAVNMMESSLPMSPSQNRPANTMNRTSKQKWALLKVLIIKNWSLGWKRGRVRQIFLPLFFYMGFIICMSNLLYDKVGGLQILSYLIPIYLTFTTMSIFQCIVVDVVSEKECKMKEIMHINGISEQMYWGAWIMCYLAYAIVCVVIIVAVLAWWTVILDQANIFLFSFAILLNYGNLFSLAFVVSIFCNTPRSAVTIGYISVLLCGSLAAFAVSYNFPSEVLQTGVRWLVCLLPNVSFYQIMSSIVMYPLDFNSQADAGMNFLNSPPDFPYVVMFFMLVVTNCWQFAFAIWLDHRWQGEHGAKKGFSFGCCGLISCCFCGLCDDDDDGEIVDESLVGTARVVRPMVPVAGNTDGMTEDYYRNTTHPLHIQNLRKEFGEEKVACNDLSFHVKQGEIFALLGHNGAGKTTLINMLIGMTSSTSGTAKVMGYDIKDELPEVRAHCSVCPQDNPIWNEYTVRQHLEFFAIARTTGTYGGEEVERGFGELGELIEKYAKALGISEKLDAMCSTLSGGQKRRMWVATSLLGNTPLVILDEPTSGMDPQSRRDFWILLKDMAKREERAIIFSTHYLEEADYLADRKVVLAKGQVKAIGTSQELKKKFGCGYWLNVVLNSHSPKAATTLMKTEAFNIIQKYLERELSMERTMQTKNKFVSDMFQSFLIPWEKVDNLGTLLDDFDNRLDEFGVEDYSIEMTSLEEVFLALGELETAEDHGNYGQMMGGSHHALEAGNSNMRVPLAQQSSPLADDPCISGSSQLERRFFMPLKQIYGMFCLRLQTWSNNRKACFNQFVIPLIFQGVLVALNVSSGKQNHRDPNNPSNPDRIMEDNPLGQMYFMIQVVGITSSTILVSFITQAVADKELRTKHLAICHGLRPVQFWMGTFLSNYAIITISYLVCPICIFFFNVAYLNTLNFAPLLMATTLVAGGACLFWGYFASAFFNRQVTVLKVAPTISSFMNLIPTIAVFIYLLLGFITVLQPGSEEEQQQMQRDVIGNVGRAVLHHPEKLKNLASGLANTPLDHLINDQDLDAQGRPRIDLTELLQSGDGGFKDLFSEGYDEDDDNDELQDLLEKKMGDNVASLLTEHGHKFADLLSKGGQALDDFQLELDRQEELERLERERNAGIVGPLPPDFVDNNGINDPSVDPKNPSVEEPTNPSVEEPKNPSVEEPKNPSVEEPKNPSVEEPKNPSVEEPKDPSVEEPKDPSVEEPKDPFTPKDPFVPEQESPETSEGPLLPESVVGDVDIVENNDASVPGIDSQSSGGGELIPLRRLSSDGSNLRRTESVAERRVRDYMQTEQYKKDQEQNRKQALAWREEHRKNRIDRRNEFQKRQDEQQKWMLLLLAKLATMPKKKQMEYVNEKLDNYYTRMGHNIHVVASFLFPQYTMAGLMLTSIVYQYIPVFMHNIHPDTKPIPQPTVWDFFDPNNYVSIPLIGALFQILMYSCLVIFMEYLDYHRTSFKDKCGCLYRIYRLFCCCRRRKNSPGAYSRQLPADESLAPVRHLAYSKDDDVLKEERRGDRSRDAINVEGLYHKFKRNKPLETKDVPAISAVAAESNANASAYPAMPSDANYLWANNSISFGIHTGECFGLLGPNGAGKTTMLSLLTGELRPPTMGSAWIERNDIRRDFNRIYQLIGMTPQFDALWEHLTGREHLRLYARVAGTYYYTVHYENSVNYSQVSLTSNVAAVMQGEESEEEECGEICGRDGLPPADTPQLSEEAAEAKISGVLRQIGLSEVDADVCSGKYSGGMKRKLSLGISMISAPRVLFLDEPSCGVDAAAKRVLWNKILHRPKGEQTVILTTHSMEEADALCNRVAIMVNGSLRCLGSTMHIKSKYGNGYHLELLLDLGKGGYEMENVEHAVIASLSDATGLNKTHFTILEKASFSSSRLKLVLGLGYQCADDESTEASGSESTGSAPKQKIRLGRIFQWCSANALEIVEDYALGQPTLEQVFLKFAKQQEQIEEEVGPGTV